MLSIGILSANADAGEKQITANEIAAKARTMADSADVVLVAVSVG